MTQTELLDTIRAEIERRRLHFNKEAEKYQALNNGYSQNCYGARDALRDLENFLDTLPEQPVIKKSNALFDKCVENCDPAVMKEVSDNIDKMLGRQPVEGLEKEFDEECHRYFNSMTPEQFLNTPNTVIARHFAEWGEKSAYKAIMKKADEVRDKRFDTDYEVKIEPAAGFDFGCVNVYHEGKLVGQYVEPKEEKKLPEGLEEAAEQAYPSTTWREGKIAEHMTNLHCQNAFIAGAEWMKRKMLEEAAEFECIGKKVKMTIQELINYYIDQECCDVADECGF